MKTLQIFISSPGDVYEERTIANRVIERLQGEYIGKVVLEPVLWEHEPLVATSTFQHQIVSPSETEIVIAILWSRLGTKLPKDFTREDGSRYDSGTEFEFEEAISGFRKNGKPDLLVYRKTAPPSVRLDDEDELMERLSQKKKLDNFIDKWFHDKVEGTLKAAFHQFESPSEFEEALENHLHKLIDRQLPKSTRSTSEARAVWKKGSPFRGLSAFHFEHSPVFFGRTKAVSDILQALRHQAADDRPFVLVLGMSGGGKSSVVRAGVLPMLTRPGVIEGVGFWSRAVFKPTDVSGDLFAGLAQALTRDHALPSLVSDGTSSDELAQILRESPQAASTLIRTALAREQAQSDESGDARLALVVDQMEEIFTQEEILPKHRKAFIDVLDALARSGNVWIVCTLRSDFYPRLSNLPKLGALKDGDGQYDLMAPTANEIGQMIRLPTRAAGLRFEEDPASSERLDDALRDAAAEHPEILPLLQFTLEELYQRRTEDGLLTLEAYRELGGVEGSLAQRAEAVFQELPAEVQAELPKILSELVSIEQDGHETIGRKRAPWADVTKGKSRDLVNAFVANRLFVTELSADGGAVVTVAHEALLWHWPQVKDWVAQNRQNLRIRARIATAAARWEREQRSTDLLIPPGKPLVEAESLLEQDIELHDDEAAFIGASMAKARRFQQLKVGVFAMVAVLAVLAGTAAFLANQQRDAANEARLRAEIEAETARETTDFMVGLFEVSDPSEALGNFITAREILDRGAEKIEAELSEQPEIQATLMETMGTVYTSLGLYEQSAKLLEKALDIRRDLHGDIHIEVAQSMERLGKVLARQANLEPAEDMFRNALSMRRELLGDTHVDTAQSIFELADVLSHQGDFKGAEVLFREAIEVQQKMGRQKSPEYADLLRELSLNLYDQGNYDEPVPLMREALALRRELHEGANPIIAEYLNDLAYLLGDLGDLYETEQIYREALDIKQKMYGGRHPEVATALNNLAYTLEDQNKLEAADEMHREALEMRRDMLGNNHPDVAISLNNLAFVAYGMGKLESAIESGRESLVVYRRAYGDDHPQVARSMYNLAIWMIASGEYANAETLLVPAIQSQRILLGEQHDHLASSMGLLAMVYVELDRFDEALRLATDAHRIQVEMNGEEHWRSAAAGSAKGAALSGLGSYDEAEALLLESFSVLSSDTGALPVYKNHAAGWLAGHYERTGKSEEAQKYLAMVDTSS